MNEALETLLKNPRVWRGHNARSGNARGLASGYPGLDRHLPGGGWPRQALSEILIDHYGRGELQLLMPALARLSRGGSAGGEEGWIAWIAPPFQPYPPALMQWGVDLSRMLVVRPRKRADILWAAEQALACGNCAAVLFWPETLGSQPAGSEQGGRSRARPGSSPVFSSRRLQLAAEKGRSCAIAFRHTEARCEVSAAALRLELVKGEQGADVVILKSRGGRPVRVQNVLHDHAG